MTPERVREVLKLCERTEGGAISLDRFRDLLSAESEKEKAEAVKELVKALSNMCGMIDIIGVGPSPHPSWSGKIVRTITTAKALLSKHQPKGAKP